MSFSIDKPSCCQHKVAFVFLNFIAEMTFGENDDKEMLDWEKANAIEYVHKDNISKNETTDNRVIAISDRCVQK